MKEQKTDCRKIQYKKGTFEYKLFVIAQITNDQISVNNACKKYDISRSSLNYWNKEPRGRVIEVSNRNSFFIST